MPPDDQLPDAKYLLSLAYDMAGHDECYYDHDDYCQTHYRNKPCPFGTVQGMRDND